MAERVRKEEEEEEVLQMDISIGSTSLYQQQRRISISQRPDVYTKRMMV
jgi:hypothetical protein